MSREFGIKIWIFDEDHPEFHEDKTCVTGTNIKRALENLIERAKEDFPELKKVFIYNAEPGAINIVPKGFDIGELRPYKIEQKKVWVRGDNCINGEWMIFHKFINDGSIVKAILSDENGRVHVISSKYLQFKE